MSQFIQIPITWSVVPPTQEDLNKRRFAVRLTYQCPTCSDEFSTDVVLSKTCLESRDSNQRDLQVMLERYVVNKLRQGKQCPKCEGSVKGVEIFFEWDPDLNIHRLKCSD